MISETKKTSFPLFRKLQNVGRFYCICEENKFIEVYYLGNTKIENIIEAHQYPEMLRIMDMINFELGFIEMTKEEIELQFSSYLPK